MSTTSQPAYSNGKICYLEIPAADIRLSSFFYEKVFNWEIREDNTGNIAFNDTVGQVSGMWVMGRVPSKEIGIIISIMVKDIITTNQLIIENGGNVIKTDLNSQEKTAWFSDPFGNVFGLYQQEGL